LLLVSYTRRHDPSAAGTLYAVTPAYVATFEGAAGSAIVVSARAAPLVSTNPTTAVRTARRTLINDIIRLSLEVSLRVPGARVRRV